MCTKCEIKLNSLEPYIADHQSPESYKGPSLKKSKKITTTEAGCKSLQPPLESGIFSQFLSCFPTSSCHTPHSPSCQACLCSGGGGWGTRVTHDDISAEVPFCVTVPSARSHFKPFSSEWALLGILHHHIDAASPELPLRNREPKVRPIPLSLSGTRCYLPTRVTGL